LDRSQKQKWELAAACFEHLQLALKTLKSPLPPLPAGPDANVASTPGLLVMTDLLGTRWDSFTVTAGWLRVP
jgi:hypothetical protein